MALFGGQRDVSLIKKFNEELINDIIDVEIAFYKIAKDQTKKHDLYGEANQKYYFSPVKISCIISKANPEHDSDEFGIQKNTSAVFAFLRDKFVELSLVPEIGDIIQYNNQYYELDTVRDNQFFAGKNPATWYGGDEHGYNVSIICEGHSTRLSRLNIVEFRAGVNE